MTTPETQSLMNARSSLAITHRLSRSQKYLDLIDAAIARAVDFRKSGEWPERETSKRLSVVR